MLLKFLIVEWTNQIQEEDMYRRFNQNKRKNYMILMLKLIICDWTNICLPFSQYKKNTSEISTYRNVVGKSSIVIVIKILLETSMKTTISGNRDIITTSSEMK